MEMAAIILVLVSAVLHSVWNLFAKKSIDKIIFIWFLILSSMVIYLPFFVYFFKGITSLAFLIIIISGLFNTIYFYFLGKTYQNGNLSLTYPITRCSTIFIPFLAFILIAEKVSYKGIIGIIIVLIGIFALHLDSVKWSSVILICKKFWGKATIFALLTALFSAFYAMTDKIGMSHATPFVYEYLREFSSLLFFTPFIFKKTNFDKIRTEWVVNRFPILLAGALMVLSYLLILMALKIDKVSYIVSLRQVGVVFGVLLGIFILKEKHGIVRIVSSIIMLGGFILIATA